MRSAQFASLCKAVDYDIKMQAVCCEFREHTTLTLKANIQWPLDDKNLKRVDFTAA